MVLLKKSPTQSMPIYITYNFVSQVVITQFLYIVKKKYFHDL